MPNDYEHYTAGDIIGEINSLVKEIELAPPEKQDTIVVPEFLLDEYVDTLLDDLVRGYRIPREYLLGETPEDTHARKVRDVLKV